MSDSSDIKGDVNQQTIPFDYIVVGHGAQNSKFGIPGVEKHACFLKEVWDATKIRTRIMVMPFLSQLLIAGLYRNSYLREPDPGRNGSLTAYGSRRGRSNRN